MELSDKNVNPGLSELGLEARLGPNECAELLLQVPGWSLGSEKADDGRSVPRLERSYSFHSYLEGLHFLQEAARIADAQDHHPEMTLGFARVKVTLWTHTAQGVTEADFILAAKYEREYQSQRGSA